MLYLFYGNSEYQIREKTLAWKKAFREKYGDVQLTHIQNLADYSPQRMTEILTGGGLFGDKKLVIIDQAPLSTTIKNTRIIALVDHIRDIIEQVPSETIVVFASVNPDKRSKLFSYLKKNAEMTEFSGDNTSEVMQIVSKRFQGQIDPSALQLLCLYKANNMSQIVSEIEKLLISSDHISRESIEKHVLPGGEESIFACIDDILDARIPSAIDKIHTMLDQINIYALYNSLVANIRTQVFIAEAKRLGVSDVAGVLGLGNRAFLVRKSYRLHADQIQKLYRSLVALDKKMKTGKMVGSQDQDFLFEIERVLISIA